ncbi:MAG TPA: septum formation initiator family protein [Gemmatimonadota bacterium]|nr:septum formation initiator family protein [Gemmatimonadota bacterium]
MSTRKLADRRQRRTRRALFWALAAVLLGYGLFAGDHRPHHLALLWLEERRTEERIEELATQRSELEERLAAVEGDPLALEELAREKGMVRPGDLVYRIVPLSLEVRKAAAESVAVQAARQPPVPEVRAGPREAPVGSVPREAREAPDRAVPAGAVDRPVSEPRATSTDPRWQWLDEPRPAGPTADTLPGD